VVTRIVRHEEAVASAPSCGTGYNSLDTRTPQLIQPLTEAMQCTATQHRSIGSESVSKLGRKNTAKHFRSASNNAS